MDEEAFRGSAELIVKRNVSSRVESVFSMLDEASGTLGITYSIDGEPSEDDQENIEIACAELLAEFSQIRSAATYCVNKSTCSYDDSALVYSRDA